MKKALKKFLMQAGVYGKPYWSPVVQEQVTKFKDIKKSRHCVHIRVACQRLGLPLDVVLSRLLQDGERLMKKCLVLDDKDKEKINIYIPMDVLAKLRGQA